ncbi:putative NRPS-like protein biosynthetic cluster [Arthromyces matolae]|nr:putative NRPS-like protein biosynthetic cluster [Arthromyces matolae]
MTLTDTNSILPTPQGASCTTFSPPPLDGSLTLPELYEYNLEHNPDHPLFVYNSNGQVVTIKWGQAVSAIRNAASITLREIQLEPDASDEAPVIAILAVLDQPSYFALVAGIMHAGFVPFPISPRNSDIGVANLLQKTKAKYMFTSKDNAMQGLAESALEVPGVDGVQILSIPSFDELYRTDDSYMMAAPGQTFPRAINAKCTALILHSSDAMGNVSLSWAVLAGATLSTFPPSEFPIVSTPDSVFESAVATNSKLIFCVPAFIEQWSTDPLKVALLSDFDAVVFGGAPIQKAVGDELSMKGIKLYPFYGATEIGGTSAFLPKQPPVEGWEYFKMSPHTDAIFLGQEDEHGTFRLVYRRWGPHFPAVTNTKILNADAYDTNDLLIRHPNNPELWKVYGRADDQIMHSTGEKTNPVPIESIINRHPSVASSLVFGRGRFQAGLLVQPIEGLGLNPDQLDSFRNLVWPSVEEANKFAPSHSRIFREMILATAPSKPFQYTPKGTPRRHVVLDLYEEEINALYQAVESSSRIVIPAPKYFDELTSLGFVRRVITSILTNRSLNDHDDFFLNGCDSLQASRIRTTILHSLRQSQVSIYNLHANFVYLNPSMAQLAQYLVSVYNPDASTHSSLDNVARTISQMNQLVEKYSANIKPHHSPLDHSSGADEFHDVILLTGSTGGLGCYLLEALVRDPTVERIYTLNRPHAQSKKSSKERQRAALNERNIDCSILESSKVVFIEADTSQYNLDLPSDCYEKLRTQVTCIIHNAWRVDFNVTISSMEPLIAGTRNLIDFALSSLRKTPPSFVFASSIGVVRNWKAGPAPEAQILDPLMAIGSGYPESKWVAERILTLAAKQSTLRPIIVRIGQMSGGRDGCWNPVEWVPSVVLSGSYLHCLPDALGFISWVPIDKAATSMVEMRKSPKMFLHLCHPRPVSWSTVFTLISRILKIPLVGYSTWLEALEDIESRANGGRDLGCEQPPALRLLDFFQSAGRAVSSEKTEAFGFPRLSMEVALSVTSAIDLPPLGEEDVTLWLKYWKLM